MFWDDARGLFQGARACDESSADDEIQNDYERNTGIAICRILDKADPMACPAALVAGHAPFCWGADVAEAAHHAVILEYVAKMACRTLGVRSDASPLQQDLQDKHHLRKHGPGAYYGQAPSR